VRAFIALELPKNLRDRMGEVVNALDVGGAKVRWVPTDQMHLTLRFLGDIDNQQLEQIRSALHEAADAQKTPVNLGVGGLGAFPNRRNPRVIWVGVTHHPGLSEVQGLLDRSAVDSGIEPEARTWSPHLTLGRVKYVATDSPLLKRLKSVRVETYYYTCDRVTLFESTLTSEGALYRPLETVTFGADKAR